MIQLLSLKRNWEEEKHKPPKLTQQTEFSAAKYKDFVMAGLGSEQKITLAME